MLCSTGGAQSFHRSEDKPTREGSDTDVRVDLFAQFVGEFEESLRSDPLEDFFYSTSKLIDLDSH